MADKKIVGIDFTSREIRLAQVSYSRGLPKLERFALGPIPDGVFSGGRLVEPGRLAETIKDLLKGYRFTAKRAVLGISGRYGITRMVTLPKMTAAQTRDAINLQLNQYVPFPPADSLYDFKVLRELKEAETPSQEVLLVASRRTSIAPLLNVVKKAGLSLVGIKITTLASFKVFEDLYSDSEQAIAFVDVRDNVTDISFVSENYFRLSRSVEFGLVTLTERIRTKLGLSHTEAVEHLYQNKVDLMESYRPAAMSTAEEGVVETSPMDVDSADPEALDRQLGLAKTQESAEKQIRDNVLRAMGQFVNELMRSIRYFESQSKRRARVGKVIVFGYIGGLEGLSEYLTEQSGLEVTVVTDFHGVENRLDAADEQELKGKEATLIVPIGLAVEGAKQKRIDLNLIPREAVFRRKSFNALKFAVVVVVIIAAILANFYIQRDTEFKDFEAQEQALQRDIASIQQFYDKSQEFKGYIQQVEGKFAGVLTLAGMQPPWPVIMDELGRLMRESSFIDEMHWDANGGSWEVHGFCIGTDEFQKLVVNFYHSDILQNIEIDYDATNLEMDEGRLGSSFGSRGIGGGFGFSEPLPQNPGQSADSPGMSSGGGSTMSERPMPEPMYKLPEGGSAWQDIEWYYQGHEYFFPIYYEFTFSGNVNPAVMAYGMTAFGEQLIDLAGLGLPGAGGGAMAGGGGTGMGVPGGMPGAPPAGGDDTGGTDE